MSATKVAAGAVPFWRRKRLGEMSAAEWESLCDGCGKCCLVKLRDPGIGRLSFTDVACRLLDLGSCRCTHYAERSSLVADCVPLTPAAVEAADWLPSSCAYRLVREGKDLPAWHPLVSGDPDSVHRAGASVQGRAVSERDAPRLCSRIVNWPQ